MGFARKYHQILYGPILAQLVIIRRCNLKCSYCTEKDGNSPPVSVDILNDRMEALRRLGTRALTLTGGEPMLHPGLYGLIEYARNAGFYHISLISNGFLLDKESVLSMNKSGLDEIQISVDGVKESRTTLKVLDNLAGQLRALHRYARFNVTLSAVIGACSPEQVEAVIDYAKKMGFSPRVLLMHNRAGQFRPPAEPVQRYETILGQIPRSVREIGNYRLKLLREGSAPFKCRAGSRYLYVDEFGGVCMCSQTRNEWSKPLIFFDMADLADRFYARKDCQDRCTLGCVRSCSELDSFRAQQPHR